MKIFQLKKEMILVTYTICYKFVTVPTKHWLIYQGLLGCKILIKISTMFLILVNN